MVMNHHDLVAELKDRYLHEFPRSYVLELPPDLRAPNLTFVTGGRVTALVAYLHLTTKEWYYGSADDRQLDHLRDIELNGGKGYVVLGVRTSQDKADLWIPIRELPGNREEWSSVRSIDVQMVMGPVWQRREAVHKVIVGKEHRRAFRYEPYIVEDDEPDDATDEYRIRSTAWYRPEVVAIEHGVGMIRGKVPV